MSLDVMNKITPNPLVSLGKLPQPDMCPLLLDIPIVKKRSQLKRAFSLRVAKEIMRVCGGGVRLSRAIGEGSYGRVFSDRKGKTAVKFQVFRMSDSDDFKQEVEMGQLFGRNGIAPRMTNFGLIRTNNPRFGAGFISMDLHQPLDKVLKQASTARRAEIMRKIQPRLISILNKMLTLGFACIDLKPHNALLSDTDQIYLIDFTADLCEKAPVLIRLKEQEQKKGGEITFKSLLPKLIRKDIIACQIIFFHCTLKVFSRAYFADDIVRMLVFSGDQLPVRNAYKMLVLGRVPRVYENFLEDERANRQLSSFLRSFSRLGSLNFLHYTGMSKDASYEFFVSFLLGRIN